MTNDEIENSNLELETNLKPETEDQDSLVDKMIEKAREMENDAKEIMEEVKEIREDAEEIMEDAEELKELSRIEAEKINEDLIKKETREEVQTPEDESVTPLDPRLTEITEDQENDTKETIDEFRKTEAEKDDGGLAKIAREEMEHLKNTSDPRLTEITEDQEQETELNTNTEKEEEQEKDINNNDLSTIMQEKMQDIEPVINNTEEASNNRIDFSTIEGKNDTSSDIKPENIQEETSNEGIIQNTETITESPESLLINEPEEENGEIEEISEEEKIKMDTERAKKMIENGEMVKLLNELDSFKKLDSEIAERIVNDNWGMAVINNLDKFQGLSKEDIEEIIKSGSGWTAEHADKLIETDQILTVLNNLEKFNDLNNKVTEKIIKDNWGMAIIDNLDKFKGLTEENIEEIIKSGSDWTSEHANMLIKAGYSSIVEKYSDKFNTEKN